MAKDYSEILNQAWDDIPDVKLLPGGSWRLKCENASYMEARDADSRASVLFVYAPVEPMVDVNQEEIDALGPDYALENNQIFYKIWLQRKADWDKVRKHIIKHGVELGPQLGVGLKSCKGAFVVAMIGQRTFNDASGASQAENTASNFVAAE